MTRRPGSRLVSAAAAVAALFLLLPLLALAVRTPWARLGTLLAQPVVADAVRVSLAGSVGAVVIAALLGLPLAWVLAYGDFRGRAALRVLTLLPMVLPPVVAGVALLLAFGRRGVAGGALAALTGASLPFSFPAVVLAGAFVATPFVVVTAEAGLRALDRGLDEAAAGLGAGRWFRLRHVTLPLLRPSLAAGLGLAWARALGEFGATITFAGNVPGRTQTLPLAVFLQLETDPGLAYALSFVLLALSAAVLATVSGRLLR